MSIYSSPKAIALVQTFALAQKGILDLIADPQCASKLVSTEDGVWHPTLVNAHLVSADMTVACLSATRDFLSRFTSCLSG